MRFLNNLLKSSQNGLHVFKTRVSMHYMTRENQQRRRLAGDKLSEILNCAWERQCFIISQRKTEPHQTRLQVLLPTLSAFLIASLVADVDNIHFLLQYFVMKMQDCVGAEELQRRIIEARQQYETHLRDHKPTVNRSIILCDLMLQYLNKNAPLRVSREWVDGYAWPVPLPCGFDLRLLRIESRVARARLGGCALPQAAWWSPEDLRALEWRLDTPTIGYVDDEHRRRFFGIGPLVFYLNKMGRPMGRHADSESEGTWLQRVWTLQEMGGDYLIGGRAREGGAGCRGRLMSEELQVVEGGRAHLEGAWKLIKQTLLVYITGEGIPKDEQSPDVLPHLGRHDELVDYAPRPALLAAIHLLPKKHFRGESYYTDILELFGDDVQDRDRAGHIFTYRDLQTAYYSFYLLVALAVYMFRVCQSYPSGTQTIEPYNLPKYILVPVDEYSDPE
ncbi:hypothetical protein EDD18DRAFT_1333646 [Armillaria luteobubalina]|uniref:Uncharacterized protein n=1 Tax=Armillaria luteobubalina TaxID=153913 RepID=A0AA39Q0Y3_9AGAR|nr:hypothetical protein EDD18DRAFT_1333646 [Armillaria luteobubalina]